MAHMKKKVTIAALFLCLILLSSKADVAEAEGTAKGQGHRAAFLSEEDIDIINNLELLEMMDLFEDYGVVEGYNAGEEVEVEEEEEEDDV